jgi:hypothetical protein
MRKDGEGNMTQLIVSCGNRRALYVVSIACYPSSTPSKRSVVPILCAQTAGNATDNTARVSSVRATGLQMVKVKGRVP